MLLRLMLSFFILFIFITPAQAEDRILPQKVSLLNFSGTAQYRNADTLPWISVNRKTQFVTGGILRTKEGGRVELGMEPAVIGVLGNNSSMKFDKLHISATNNNVLTKLMLYRGSFWAEMPSYVANNLFYSIETSLSTLYLRKATVKVTVQKGETQVEVYKGAVKIRQKSSGKEVILYQNKRATIVPGSNTVSVFDMGGAKADTTDNQLSGMSVAMLSISSPKGPKQDLEPLSDFVAQEIESQSEVRVLFLEDVRSILRPAGLSHILRCPTDSCIAEIGNYLGVDLLVIGKLGQLGTKYIFNLKLVDALRDRTIKRVSTAVEQDVSTITDEIPTMVNQLITARKKTRTRSFAEVQRITDSIANLGPYKNMVWIFPDTFAMGSHKPEGDKDELPLHKVTVKGFFIDKYEVTRQEFKNVMDFNPSKFKGCQTCPVENVTWFEARDYCQKVGKRLPTEAEWEYACRSGTNTVFNYGNSLSSDQANFDGRKPFGEGLQGVVRNKPLPVGSFKPNDWQLFDMHGNVWEWCSDWYSPTYYGKSKKSNPQGPKQGKFKVVRGGSWKGDAASLRSANRISYNPQIKLNTVGFRCVKDYSK